MNKKLTMVAGVFISIFCFSTATHSFAKDFVAGKENNNPYEYPEYQPIKDEMSALEKEALNKISEFALDLKQELVVAIRNSGMASAVEVCRNEAPKIAEALSVNGWKVARTSLKVRNTNNQPTDWEREVLTMFDAQFKAGTSPNLLTSSTLDDASFRYMKAIPTGQLCLACHGSQVKKSILNTINANYPQDKATGFTLEDIRGAFSVTYSLETE